MRSHKHKDDLAMLAWIYTGCLTIILMYHYGLTKSTCYNKLVKLQCARLLFLWPQTNMISHAGDGTMCFIMFKLRPAQDIWLAASKWKMILSSPVPCSQINDTDSLNKTTFSRVWGQTKWYTILTENVGHRGWERKLHARSLLLPHILSICCMTGYATQST